MASKKKKPAKKKAAPKRVAKKKAPAKKKAVKRAAPKKKTAAKKAAPKKKTAAKKAAPKKAAPKNAVEPSLAVTLQSAAIGDVPANLTARHAPVDDFTSSGDELVDIFQKYDRDRTGYIERNEFARLLEALGQNPGEEELAVALDVVDPMRLGKVSFQEFKRWWTAR